MHNPSKRYFAKHLLIIEVLFRLIFALFIITAFWASADTVSGGELPAKWTEYMGAAGSVRFGFNWLDTLENEGADFAPWAKSIRGVGRRTTSLNQMLGIHRQDPRTTKQFHRLEKVLGDTLESYHRIIIPVRGMPFSDKVERLVKFTSLIKSDNGKLWKQLVVEHVISLESVRQKKQGTLYWQIGNEINNQKFSSSVQAFKGNAATAKGFRSDPDVIPVYVEYFLAPTVEGINKASEKLYGKPGEVNILLGTIGGFYRGKARPFLDQLLNYRVRGRYAPTLAGKRVFELVDFVGFQYLLSWGDSIWEERLDDIFGKWYGRGRIRGLWSTEEIGSWLARKNFGAGAALKVVARYLHWCSKNGISPEQGSTFFWGWRMGNKESNGEEGLRTLYEFLGNTNLREINGGIRVANGLDAELYLFESVPQRLRVGFLMPEHRKNAVDLRLPIWSGFIKKRKLYQGNANVKLEAITNAKMLSAGWSGPAEGKAVLFARGKKKVIPIKISEENDGYRIALDGKITLGYGEILMFLIQHGS
jgi:hypothetical protein